MALDRKRPIEEMYFRLVGEKEELIEEYKELLPLFGRMEKLSSVLRERRKRRGAIDFDFPESKILLDENGHPLEIRPYERNTATRIIEDFMLLANETVAEDYYWQSVPFLYRTHDTPDPEKMKQLGVFINNFGYFIRMQQGEIHPKELQKLLDRIEGTPEEPLLARLTLRSMKQAKYTTECSGHFGLAARYYTHFTSHPALSRSEIHCIMLCGEDRSPRLSVLNAGPNEADETDKLKKCEYMARYVGETFEGVISGVANWGFW